MTTCIFPRLLATLGAEGPSLILLRGANYSEVESIDCVRRVLMPVAQDELTRSYRRCRPGEDPTAAASSKSRSPNRVTRVPQFRR